MFSMEDVTIYRRVKIDNKHCGFVELTGVDFSQEEGLFPEIETDYIKGFDELYISDSSCRNDAQYIPITSEQLMDLCRQFNRNLFGKPSQPLFFTSLGDNITDYISAKYLDSIRFCNGYGVIYDTETKEFKATRKFNKKNTTIKEAI